MVKLGQICSAIGRRKYGAAMALFLTLAATPAAAQAICSGPHAGPGRPTSGALRTEYPGAGWIQATLFHHDAGSFYNSTGNVQDFQASGQVETSSLFLTGAVGLVPGLDAMVQLPVHRLRFSNAGGTDSRTGLGDPRVYLRASPEIVGLYDIPIAVRAGVKLIGSEFPVDSRVIPITEGQRDYEVMVESGHAFYSLPLYLRGWVGYRWRDKNPHLDRTPGDERFGYLAAGGPLGPIGWEIAVEGLSGLTPQQQGISIPTARRRLVQIYPSLAMAAGPGQVELGGRVPLQGRNYPTGSAVSLGYSWRWGD